VLRALRAVVGCTGLVSSGVLALGLARDVVTAAGQDQRQAGSAAHESSPALAPQVQPEMTPPPAPSPAPAAHIPPPQRQRPTTFHRVYRVTAYDDWGVTASGRQVGVGQCAAPADIPFGARVYIPALRREFVVTDRTHPRFRHNTVDLFMPGEDNCRQFGRRYLKCIIRLPATKTRNPERR
jgi:3D (Asp-Asp-Asp) domain-containing protein